MIGSSETGPVIKVGMAQYRVATPPASMMTVALGSCLGLILYDPVTRVGGLAHVMHPSRERVRNNVNRAKFVDTAIDLMLSRMSKKGAARARITAKIFGGAQMFGHVTGSRGVIQIGRANVDAARRELAERKIPIVADATGGSKGRTLLFDLSDGSVRTRDAGGKEEIY